MKLCCRCKENKNESEFGFNKTNLDGFQRYCKKCKKGIAKKWYNSACKNGHIENVRRNTEKYRRRIQDIIWQHFKNHPCKICNESDPILLEFDHINAESKEFNIGEMIRSASIKRILEEIEKCQVLCSNCHRRKTAQQFKTWKYIRSLQENALIA